MDVYDYYDDAASTIKVDDITTDEVNRQILRKLREDDPEFDRVQVCADRHGRDDNEYYPENSRSLEWLGHYIGKNTNLKALQFETNLFRGFNSSAIETFFRGVNSNRSIQRIYFFRVDLMGGEIFRSLSPFFENNGNLSELGVEQCEFGAGCARQVALALRGCNSSLKSVMFSDIQVAGGEPLSDVIEALSVHSRLEKLELVKSMLEETSATH